MCERCLSFSLFFFFTESLSYLNLSVSLYLLLGTEAYGKLKHLF